jgi:LacI family transcriptional regulator
MAKKKLSIEDIARLSGVSRSTVSRVINDQPYVSEANREKVWQVIRENDYHPNIAAKTLASQRSKVLGVLIPHNVSDLFTDHFFPVLLEGITLASNELGYGVMLWLATARNNTSDFYTNAFNKSMIDGLLIASATFDATFLAWLNRFNKPFVFVGAAPPSMSNVSFVDVDNLGGGLRATQHLIEVGCRRIGFIEGRTKQIASIRRREGYIQALQMAGLPVDPNLIIPDGNYTEAGGYQCMKQLLSQNVDGVFAANDMSAIGAMRAIRDAGLSIPEDIALIGFDNISLAGISIPPLSTISQPIGMLGAEATKTLVYVLENKPPHPMYKILPVELVVRESTAKSVQSVYVGNL